MRNPTLLILALVLAGCQLGEERPMPDQAPAPARFQACQQDSDCAIVDISCNQCCQQDAVNRSDSSDYMEHKSSTCVGRPGAICKCEYVPVRAACEQGLCRLKTLKQD